MYLKYAAAAALAATLTGCADSPAANSEETSFDAFTDLVSAEGVIGLPANYQTDWQYMGAFSVLNAEATGAGDIHVVYTNPGTIEAYQATGEYPDGAVLLKEVRAASTEQLTTGTASYAAGMKVVFIMVKDREGRYADTKLWGDGWGWGLYNYETGEPVFSTTDYKAECFGCHIPVADQDYSYIQGYAPIKSGY